jgi:iron-sulfur cluster assembly protein
MINISDSAREQLLKLMSSEGKDPESTFVRVGVESGGCSGLSYKLDFDAEKREEDKLFEEGSVNLLVDKKSFFYLIGTTLEYSSGLNGKGFQFVNPNASRTCGCGESFAV